MTFRDFQSMNAQRCATRTQCSDWTLNDWAVALSGEVGELCNLLKKMRRGDVGHSLAETGNSTHSYQNRIFRQALLSELADVITYADLLITELGADTGEEVLRKFDEVSARFGYTRPGQKEDR